MSRHFGGLFVLLSFILEGHLLESSVDVKDLAQAKCRIAGVVLVDNKDRSKKFNYTMAESACQVLGLQLASKDHMEKALGYGYETCNYGWVSNKIGVIPRIQNNENCGKNKTGVLSWVVELNKTFVSAYCFNVSDTQINSCKPGLMVTEPLRTVMVPTSASSMTPTSVKTETQTVKTLMPTTHVRTTAEVSTTSLYTTSMSTAARTPPSTTLQTTPLEDTEPPKKQENQMAQKNERLVFGGLPTTLLILALVFFVAAVALAVCYIKKDSSVMCHCRYGATPPFVSIQNTHFLCQQETEERICGNQGVQRHVRRRKHERGRAMYRFTRCREPTEIDWKLYRGGGVTSARLAGEIDCLWTGHRARCVI